MVVGEILNLPAKEHKGVKYSSNVLITKNFNHFFHFLKTTAHNAQGTNIHIISDSCNMLSSMTAEMQSVHEVLSLLEGPYDITFHSDCHDIRNVCRLQLKDDGCYANKSKKASHPRRLKSNELWTKIYHLTKKHNHSLSFSIEKRGHSLISLCHDLSSLESRRLFKQITKEKLPRNEALDKQLIEIEQFDRSLLCEAYAYST